MLSDICQNCNPSLCVRECLNELMMSPKILTYLYYVLFVHFFIFFPYRYISFQDENNVTSRDEDVLITPLPLITLYHISQCCGPVANCQTVIGIVFLHSKLHLYLYMVFNYFSIKCSIFAIAKHRLGK